MKSVSKITQWICSCILGICALANGFHFSTIFLLLSAVLFMPLPAIRNFLKDKAKIKSWLSITLAILLLIVGISVSPPTEKSNSPSDNSSTSSTLEDSPPATSSEDTSDKESALDQSSSETNDKTNSSDTSSEENKVPPSSVGSGTAVAVNPENLPSFSEKAYITVNNNIPNFSAYELTSKGYEKYSVLDHLGRTGVAIASVGKDTMPAQNEERGNISSITPTGWMQAQYDCISGGWLYNRCHLIGWQLSDENANKSNLITGTRFLNINGMLPFENMVADYIKETGNHVAYRITPIYVGDNLLASGVQMEAFSVEDNGDGICFNVYCYNVQPEITIDYATGASSGPSNSEPPPSSSAPSSKPDNNTNSSDMVWIPNSGSKYHSYSGCSKMKNPSQVSKSEAEKRGYEPCKKCW